MRTTKEWIIITMFTSTKIRITCIYITSFGSIYSLKPVIIKKRFALKAYPKTHLYLSTKPPSLINTK
jgi:hypothetical protein